MRAASKAVIKLFFTVYGERRGFLIMEWTTRVIVLALFLEFYAHVDQIDDIGSRQQVINEYAWDSSSHMPLLYTSFFRLP
ncbi:Uncharacterised protein [Salmonella enterica subsp. enterica serovar Typhimurium str. DT104]|nr:Uncharacterised protein [Salmonella enterica subsp. enterica serovar Typhimurium str. DT104]